MISQDLKDAYKWHRQQTANVSTNFPAKTALAALEAARKDVTAGKARYPSNNVGNLGAPFNDGLQWCESPNAIGLRLVGYADEVRKSIDHKGWYLDNDIQDEVARGIVFQLPARNGKPVYIAGIADPFNDGPAVVNLTTLWVDDKEGAAREADRIAERYAEDEREFRAVDQAAFQYGETFETVKAARAAIIEAVQAWRGVATKIEEPARIVLRSMVARAVSKALADRCKALKQRKELASDYGWREEWSERLSDHGIAA